MLYIKHGLTDFSSAPLWTRSVIDGLASPMKASEIIQKARKAKKLTQQALADQVGVTVQAVSQWERGSTRPNIFTAVRLASVLDLERDWLLNEDWMPAELRAKIDKKLPKSRYAGGYQGFIPVIDLKDAAYFRRKINNSKSVLPSHKGLVQTTKLSKGYNFAIEIDNDDNAPDIVAGDLLIFNCEIFPDDNDFVCSQIEGLPHTESVIGKYLFHGDDPFAFIIQADGPPLHCLGVSGTMIEHRRFRQARPTDMTDDNDIDGISSDA